MATNHRGNPVNDNNKAKTNKERMGLSDEQIENPDGTFRELSEKDLAEGYEEGSMTYPDGSNYYPEPYDDSETPEQEEIAERKSQAYMKEMEEYYRPVSDRTYGKDEMIENDIDDDKY